MAVAEKPTLAEQIQSDALDDSTSLAGALRKCVALGGLAGSAELREWAGRELRGYFDDAEPPDYRKIVAPIVIDGAGGGRQFTRMQISTHDLAEPATGKFDENLRLRSGVGELEEMVRRAREDDAEIRLGLPGAATLAKLMSHERGHYVERVYWSVSPTAVVGVLDQVRTRLVELAAEIIFESGDEEPSAQVVGNAMSVVVSGRRARVNLTAAQGGGSAATTEHAHAPADRPWWRTTKALWAFAVGAATIAAAVIAWAQWR